MSGIRFSSDSQDPASRRQGRSGRRRARRPLGLVEHGDVGFDAVLVHQPIEHRGRAIGRIAGQALGLEAEPLFGPADHGLGRGHLGLAYCGRRLDVDDDTMVKVDQIVVGVCEEGLPAMGAGPALPGRLATLTPAPRSKGWPWITWPCSAVRLRICGAFSASWPKWPRSAPGIRSPNCPIIDVLFESPARVRAQRRILGREHLELASWRAACNLGATPERFHLPTRRARPFRMRRGAVGKSAWH